MTITKKRMHLIDALRGLAIINMVLYHGLWDGVYIAGWNIPWFHGVLAYLWQQSICWTFIFLTGFCFSLSRNSLRRGCIVFGAGMLVSLVTNLITPEDRILFGVLTLLGSSMLLTTLLKPLLERIPPSVGMSVSFLLFLILKPLNIGGIGFLTHVLIALPKEWYDGGYIMTFFGFPFPEFFSTDYFSLLPWYCLFLTGYYFFKTLQEKNLLQHPFLYWGKGSVLTVPGRYSLWIYLLHQPVLYGFFLLMGI